MSHPTKIDIDSQSPSTGYSTQINKSSEKNTNIEKVVFICSPWVDPKSREYKPQIYSNKSKAQGAIKDINNHNQDLVLIPKKINNKFHIYDNKGKDLIQFFKAELTVMELKKLVLELSNYLSQPIDRNWDGCTFHQHIAT